MINTDMDGRDGANVKLTLGSKHQPSKVQSLVPSNDPVLETIDFIPQSLRGVPLSAIFRSSQLAVPLSDCLYPDDGLLPPADGSM